MICLHLLGSSVGPVNAEIASALERARFLSNTSPQSLVTPRIICIISVAYRSDTNDGGH